MPDRKPIPNFNQGTDGKPMPVHLCTYGACDIPNCPGNANRKDR